MQGGCRGEEVNQLAARERGAQSCAGLRERRIGRGGRIAKQDRRLGCVRGRQRIASDARMQSFLQTWRTMFPGALEMDVYQEV